MKSPPGRGRFGQWMRGGEACGPEGHHTPRYVLTQDTSWGAGWGAGDKGTRPSNLSPCHGRGTHCVTLVTKQYSTEIPSALWRLYREPDKFVLSPLFPFYG